MGLLAAHGHSHQAQRGYTLAQFRGYLEAALDLEARRTLDQAQATQMLLLTLLRKK